MALPASFGETDPGRDRDIQTLHAAAHRNTDELVAVLTREPPHAFAFGAEHPRTGARKLRGIQVLLGALVGAGDPDVALFELPQRAREVCHCNVRHRFGGPARHLRYGRVDSTG